MLEVEKLGGFEDFPGLLELPEFAFFLLQLGAHLGDFLFLLADLLEHDFDRGFLHPWFAVARGLR